MCMYLVFTINLTDLNKDSVVFSDVSSQVIQDEDKTRANQIEINKFWQSRIAFVANPIAKCLSNIQSYASLSVLK